jgi:hypothetical protein
MIINNIPTLMAFNEAVELVAQLNAEEVVEVIEDRWVYRVGEKVSAGAQMGFVEVVDFDGFVLGVI